MHENKDKQLFVEQGKFYKLFAKQAVVASENTTV
jgi:DNA mismatch repair ATPase MutS